MHKEHRELSLLANLYQHSHKSIIVHNDGVISFIFLISMFKHLLIIVKPFRQLSGQVALSRYVFGALKGNDKRGTSDLSYNSLRVHSS